MARERKFSTSDLFQSVKHILLQHGYDGFTISLLADRLEVSRGALYKYYDNKDELITQFMVYEMEQFIDELKEINSHTGFEPKFSFLMETIFNKTELHQLIPIAKQIKHHPDGKENKDKLEKLPLEMYRYLQDFISTGKKEGKLKSHIPDSVMLGMIFQSVAIPNHFGIPKAEWIASIKDILSDGMFVSR
ncbi:TetR/AcrR family transcriptional regulator [Mesobacillus foraminis]|uniref:TetR family transcriptional regulator n=1 Tax=Mesobacillus foraminis TaxID=279826 RepID=A0A4R2BBV2_9BACI|nr:TetR/AcrR family transcriptional regulator [Mesobacillus foraminis]TCN23963.1 TetR family transcriptional regulator [Mesobacillus foraminis]